MNKANKFWSDACAPEKGADCTVPSVWSLLATARQIKQGKGKEQSGGGNSKFYVLNWACSIEKKGQRERSQYFPELSVLTGEITPDDIFHSNPWKGTWTSLQVLLKTSVLLTASQAANLYFVLESSSFAKKHLPTFNVVIAVPFPATSFLSLVAFASLFFIELISRAESKHFCEYHGMIHRK